MKKLVFAFAMILALSVAAVSCTDKEKKADSSQAPEATEQVTDTLNNAEVGDTLNKADEVKAEKTDAAAPEEKSAPAEEVKAEGSEKSEEAK